jgi:hypothetical protein
VTPAAIISLVKDIVIVAAIGFLVFIFVTYGKDVVKVADMKAVQKQLTENSATIARWQKESTDADANHVSVLAQITASIDKQRAPVFVRGPTCPNAVPAPAPKAGDSTSAPRVVDTGRGIDYRPVINQFELKYETALTDCYTALDKWPK